MRHFNGMRDKILILGGSSFVGRHLFARLGSERAMATYCRRPIDGGVHFDSLSMNLSDIIKDPKVISHAVVLLGDTNPDTCAADRARSQALNVDSIKAILDTLRAWRIKPIFTSSEFVFDGTKGNYTEEDSPNPILTYGRQKLEIERYLQSTGDDFIVLRLAKVYGAKRGDRTLFTRWMEDIEQGRPIRCASDQVFSPIHVEDVADGVLLSIRHGCKGIFHLCGSQAFSRIRLLEILMETMKDFLVRPCCVIPCSIHDFSLVEKRPMDVSMKPDKLVRAVGLRIREVMEMCRQMGKEGIGSCPM